MNNTGEIFFHVGLAKTASTFLQSSVFPKLKGIFYLPTVHYRHSKKVLPKLDHSKVLVSREFDVQLEEQLDWFTKSFTNPQVIVVFRQHHHWIASQYRRFVKNGYRGTFHDFIDIRNDEGFWEKQDLYFFPMIEVIKRYTHRNPIVLFYEDLKSNPKEFVKNLASHLKCEIELDSVNFKPVHTSFSDKQLKVLQSFVRKFRLGLPKTYHNRIKNWLFFRPVWAFYHLILYLANFIPNRWVDNNELISCKYSDEIKLYFQEDWEQVKEYAKKHLSKSNLREHSI